jgi:hypothetical protein
VRVPIRENRLCLVQVLGGADDEQTVIEGQLDQTHHQLALVEHKGA